MRVRVRRRGGRLEHVGCRQSALAAATAHSRRAIEGSPHAHEIAFFDSELWNVFVEYMRAARRGGGGGQQRVQRIHWNVMAIEQRIPWVLEEPDATLRVVARPRIRA